MAAPLAVLDNERLHRLRALLCFAADFAPAWVAATTSGQLLNTELVAVFSGVIATTLFLHTRVSAINASQLAAVDATQASELLLPWLARLLFSMPRSPTPLASRAWPSPSLA